ncbi:YveK family protein, partial [Enterococcus cecorum]
VKDQLKENYGINMTVQEIDDAIDVVQSENSLMFSLVATSTKALDAERLANTTATIFKDTVKEVLGESVDKISIISNATVNNTPISPNNTRNLLIGVLAGMIVGFGMSFAVEFLDRTVKSEKFVRDELGLTILGTIPQLSAKELQDNTRRASGHVVSSNSGHHHSGNSKHRRSRSRV